MDPTEELILRRAAGGDPESFRELFERHRDMVFAACHRVLGNAADAEEASQETFLLFVRKCAGLRAPVGGWLHHVATQVSINMLRQRRSRAARDRKAASERGSAAGASWDDVKEAVDEAIARLPEDLRVPIVLHYLEGRKLAEIGRELEISESAVSKRLSRAVATLQALLRRKGWAVTLGVLAGWLGTNAAEAAPASLGASLGKLALAARSSYAASGAAGSGSATKGVLTGFAIVAAAGLLVVVGMGAFVLFGLKAAPTAHAPVATAPKTPVARQLVRLARPLAAGMDLIYAMEGMDRHGPVSGPLSNGGQFFAVLRLLVVEADDGGALVAETMMDMDYSPFSNQKLGTMTSAIWTGRLPREGALALSECWSTWTVGRPILGMNASHSYTPTGIAAQRLIHPGVPGGELGVGTARWEHRTLPILKWGGMSSPVSMRSELTDLRRYAGRPCARIRNQFAWTDNGVGEMLVDVETGHVQFLQERRVFRNGDEADVLQWRLRLLSARVLPPEETATAAEMIRVYDAERRGLEEASRRKGGGWIPIEFTRRANEVLDNMVAGVPPELRAEAQRTVAADPLRIENRP